MKILVNMEEKEFKVVIPEGFEIDKEKSTSEKIIFKRKDGIVEWDQDYGCVRIHTDKEHFIINTRQPDFCCTYDQAKRYFTDISVWKLPTKEQLQIIYENWKKIQDCIKNNNGFELIPYFYWSSDIINESFAWTVDMSNGYICNLNKHSNNYVRAVHNLRNKNKN